MELNNRFSESLIEILITSFESSPDLLCTIISPDKKKSLAYRQELRNNLNLNKLTLGATREPLPMTAKDINQFGLNQFHFFAQKKAAMCFHTAAHFIS